MEMVYPKPKLTLINPRPKLTLTMHWLSFIQLSKTLTSFA